MKHPWTPWWLDRALLAATVTVWAVALPVPAMDVDAAQYATMARELLERGDWLRITNRGGDYLDKPPLVFWTTALSYAAFGVGTVASKVPSFLFALLAVFSTERLARRLYDEATGRIAALVLASTQALFLVTNDCRTDTLLMGAVAFAAWQLVVFERDRTWGALFGSALGLSLALHAKGPIGAAIPLLALATDVAARRAWRSVLDPKWLLVGVLVAASLVPMLVGLHDQYGTRGPLFFLWTQSFGRITGSNQWRDTTTPLFFTHTFLWSFLPWSVFAVVALFGRLASLVRARFRVGAEEEAFTVGGFVIGFVGLSMSQYKLPHYLFVVFPLAAVLTARWLSVRLDAVPALGWRIGRSVVLAAIAVLGLVLCTVVFPGAGAAAWLVAATAVVLAVAIGRSRRDWFRAVVAPGVLVMAGANVLLGGHFYPSLLHWQSGTQAGRAALSAGVEPTRVFSYRVDAYSLDVAVGAVVRKLPGLQAIRAASAGMPLALYTDAEGVAELRSAGVPFVTVGEFEHFHVTMLTGTFLNPATRANAVKRRYLVRIGPGVQTIQPPPITSSPS